jgi:DNA-binding GntR family transcriptional regulator
VGSTDGAGLRTELLSEQVYRRLRASIIQGELEPGARLVESEIARALGVSQAPVRDAIRRLTYEGFSTNVARKGSHVAEISREEVAQARRVRAVLEAQAAREAVEAWSPQLMDGLRGEIDRMRAAATAGDPVAFRDADASFHRRVFEVGGNTYLLRAWNVLEPSFYGLQVIGDPFQIGHLPTTADAHAQLLDLLASGDAEVSAAAFARHATGQ